MKKNFDLWVCSHPTLKKIIMELKIAFFITVISVSNIIATPTYSQIAKVSLNMESRSLEQVMDEIERQSEFYFIFNQKQIDINRIVNIQEKNMLITDILPELFYGTNVNYTVLDRKILLTTDKLPLALSGVKQESYPQQSMVTGIVTDRDGTPLPGVNVVITGTTVGVITNMDGKYSIDVPQGSNSLTFSFIGMESREVSIGKLSQIDVAMFESSVGLKEVVVIGYGSQRKENVIGSVSTMNVEEITAAPVSSMSNALAGRMPGAIIQQRSGEPGRDGAQLLIRGVGTLGNSKPLIVVDGIPGRDLNSINANEVESISILKDASAAIYGARSANGVVLVTTKKGKEGTPATFNYSFYLGQLSPTQLPKMADAGTYAQMLREMQLYKGTAESNMTFSQEDVEKYKSGKYPWTHPSTNWADVTLRKHTQTAHHDFSVNGGTNSIKYYASFGKQFDDGLYINSANSFNRYNLRSNIDIKLNKYLDLGLQIAGIQENRKDGSQGAGTVFNVMNQSKPTDYSTFPNGFYGRGSFGSSYQPQLIATDRGGTNNEKRYIINNKVNATLKIPGVDGLTLSGYYAYDVTNAKRKLFNKAPSGAYSFNKAAYLEAGNTGMEDGSAFLTPSQAGWSSQLQNYYNNYSTNTLNLTLDYTKVFNGVHSLSAFVAFENSQYNEQGFTAYREGFISNTLPYLFAGADEGKNNSETISLDARVNYFGRVSYNYKETYLLQVGFRRDGSLRFSKDNGRWGNFPSVLAGWRISNESFWKDNINFINYLKLKASWAQMGNDLVPAFQYMAFYGVGTGQVFGSGTYYPGLYQTNVPNPLITWEVANNYNIGFESQLFDSRFVLNADFFYQRRSNILIRRNASVPGFTGLSLPDENYGIVDNKGLEIELGYNSKTSGDFSYSVNGNFAFARNKVINFDEPETAVPWQRLTGHPIGATLLYKSNGIFRDVEQINSTPHVGGAIPGDVIILDYDKNGEITEADRILVDKTWIPEITFGLSFNVSYRNWSLNGLVSGAANAQMRMLGSQQGTAGDYFQLFADGRWTPENINATMPRAYDGFTTYWRNTYATELEYQNQDYARMKNLQLTYTFPQILINKVSLKNAQIYFSGDNLFVIYASKYRIWDPEFVGEWNDEYGSRDNYPIMKTLTLGARISF